MSEFPYNIKFNITKDTKELFDTLMMERVNRDRSSVSIDKNKGLITIDAKDPVALRASFDGIIKLIITFDKMKNEVK